MHTLFTVKTLEYLRKCALFCYNLLHSYCNWKHHERIRLIYINLMVNSSTCIKYIVIFTSQACIVSLIQCTLTLSQYTNIIRDTVTNFPHTTITPNNNMVYYILTFSYILWLSMLSLNVCCACDRLCSNFHTTDTSYTQLHTEKHTTCVCMSVIPVT